MSTVVLDLNPAIAASGQPPRALPSKQSAAPSQTAAPQPNFADTLSSVQASSNQSTSESPSGVPIASTQSQNEPFALTQRVLPFQPGTPGLKAIPAADSDNGSGTASSQEFLAAQVNSTSTPASTPTPESVRGSDDNEDSCVKSQAKNQAKDDLNDQFPSLQAGLLNTQATGAKSTEKSKHRKDAAVNERTASAQVAAGDAASTEADLLSSPLQPPGETITRDAGLPAPQDETVSANGTKSPRPKVTDPNAGLAFALRIQGNTAVAGKSGAVADPESQANTNGRDSSSAFAAELNTMTTGSLQKNPITSTSASDKVGLAASALTYSGTENTTACPPSNLHASVTPASEAPKTAEAEGLKTEDIPENQPQNAQALKSVQVQITSADNQHVELRLVEKSGALSMSVRSSDGTLTRSLQQNLPELSGKLSEQQIRTEWWKPDFEQVNSSQKSETGSDSRSGGNSPGQDQGGQSKGNSGRQDERKPQQPDWLEALSTLPKSNQNGVQYTWHL